MVTFAFSEDEPLQRREQSAGKAMQVYRRKEVGH
ncbi:hypothetical protein PC129_g20723 [Phytophthora cactorum]|uniref:Uncharacterized protein n=1 Tax=Phytophthora cactorum TaxID=29920 RepID=A0A8T0Y5L9_9STRA|nr:hypothetical protein Pcac1_g17828 [Phytophthora cactorum]KAG2798023.1 hypothetical protein PC112_g21533 [Phytophthora cactorum]KAG2828631.1 hypothetical protein PC113_g21430 [Phytophthora cactorum]KAG2877078.1 hypothetical protein PC114_g23844 [Phytophthora cactorum]KAG2884771.1 hypothetical protein PC115_g21236 [Phytophthora cactorum]